MFLNSVSVAGSVSSIKFINAIFSSIQCYGCTKPAFNLGSLTNLIQNTSFTDINNDAYLVGMPPSAPFLNYIMRRPYGASSASASIETLTLD